MKAHLDIAHAGTVGSDDRTRMTFDENSIAHLMSVLTDLYSDPALAVIREYSTNARDAHRSIGNDAAIEVTLPTALAPVFSVRDFGPGLSITQITDNFSKYGWSSKRDSDNEVGMLGLGCKSALSYTSQFTLVSFHGGLKITVLVTRDPDGCGIVQIVDTTPSSEPSGVEVRVPVTQARDFEQKAEQFFGFWEPSAVNINGAPPKLTHTREGEHVVRLDDDVYLLTHNRIDTCYVVMGDVPYPIDSSKMQLLPPEARTNCGVIIRVPIGSIDFTPSREALHYTKRTLETLYTARRFLEERTKLVAQKLIDEMPTAGQAIQLSEEFRKFFMRETRFFYRGDKIPQWFEYQDGCTLAIAPHAYERDASSFGISVAPTSYWLKVPLIVTGFTANHMPLGIKSKLRLYCAQNGIKSGRIHLVAKENFGHPWLADVPTVSYSDIKAIVDPNALSRPKPPPRLAYRRLGYDGRVVISDDRPHNVVGYMLASEECDRDQLKSLLTYDCNVLIVNKSAEKWFVKNEPNLPHVKSWLVAEAEKLRKKINEVEVHERGGTALFGLRFLWPNCILDPELKDLIGLARQANGDALRSFDNLCAAAKQFGETVEPVAVSPGFSLKVRAILRNYPLLSTIRYSMTTDAHDAHVQALNALYLEIGRAHV